MSLSHDIVIPPFHTKFLYGHVPIKSLDDALFTPNVALQHTRMVLIPHSLLHIRNNRGVISIINNTRHSKMIPRNTPLGFISSSTTTADINVISTSYMDSSHFSLPSISLLSCTHCNVRFSTESALYNHLFHCCNKDLTSTTNTINSLVEHIDDPVKKMKVYIMLHRYSSLFDDLCLQGITCKPQSAINTGSHSPVTEHPRRVSHLNRQVINKEVQKMLNNRIIEPSNSPWAAPVVIVPLAPDERPKTAFTTPDGLWEFTRLPQGLKNSPSVFQRLMHQTLGSLRFEICLAYLDDVVVFSPSFEQHLLDVTQVCRVLNESNFKLNYNKCAFFHSEIPFLGHKVTPDGCSPNDDNIRSIMQFPLPQSSKAAHSFLQMVGFYRKFIPRFGQISAPLNKFTSKGFPFIWTEAEQLSFDQLKYALTSPMVLILPDPSRQYVIRTDASRVGVGAVLLQTQPSDPNDTSHTPIYKPVAFASRSLKKAEKNYSAIELEALAIWWSVTQKFRSYVEGQQFLLETDHKPLLSLMKKPYHNARIERWMVTLQQYDMIIQHISGKDNTTADALSRYPVDHPNLIDDDTALLHTSSTQTDDLFISMVTTRSMTRQHLPLVPSTTTTSSSSPLPRTPISSSTSPPNSPPIISSSPSLLDIKFLFDHDTLHQHQHQDPVIQKIKNISPLNSKYKLDDHDILYKIVTRSTGHVLEIPYVPASLISQVLLTYHNSTFNGGHFGIKRTFYKIRDRFFWPNMYKDIVRHISSCINCRKNKPSRRKPDGHLHTIEPPRSIWERLAMDYVGPVPQSKSGNKYFLVLTDLFSKFVITKAVGDNTSTTAAKFLLYDVFMIYGVPLEIITDNGQHFCSSLYESLLKLTQCCHVKTTPYNPQANGQCERHNATLVPNLVALSNQSRSNWDDKLLATTFNYNATRHDSTGYTPFELMFARPPRFIADLSSSTSFSSHNVSHFHDTMQQFIEHAKIAARQNNLRHQLSSKTRYDRNRLNPQYSIGQSVLIRIRNPHVNKFSSKFIGPYTIIDQLHSKTYVVENSITQHKVQVPVHDIRSIT
ncbi:unnamed protein product [Adineta steineri]|uniref:Integrase catalytic domain-containing protein n=1 Tax=Adineta steineri TaxID=433720 RepID=A0A815F032_9BILA|nr:unnamed protein product [Adineta steineri]